MNSKSPRFRNVVVSGSLALTFAYVFAGGACGGGGSGGAAGHAGTAGATGTAGAAGAVGTTFPNTPVGQCEQFVSTFCRRLTECTPADAGAPDMATCTALFLAANNCAAVTAANSSNIGTCISDVGGESCSSLFGTSGFVEPMSCSLAFQNVPLSDAQSKCVTLVEEVCDPVDACEGQEPASTADVTDCIEAGLSPDQGLGCEFATGASSTITQCLSDLCVPPPDGGADGGAAAPASCTNPFTYPMGATN